MRKFAVAVVTAALAGTIAVTVPAGTAGAAPAALPDPISGRCAADGFHGLLAVHHVQ